MTNGNLNIRANSNSKIIWLSVLFVLTFSLLTRFYLIEANSVWLDEAWILFGLFEPESGYLNPFDILGIFNVIMYAFSSVFGLDNEFKLRFIPAITGVMTCLLVWRLSSDLMSRSFSLIATFIVVCSPLLIVYSQDYSVYMFSCFFITLHFFYFAKWIKEFRPRYAVLFGLCGLIAINSRPQLAFFTFVLISSVVLWKPVFVREKLKSILVASLPLMLAVYPVLKAFLFIDMMEGRSSESFDLASLARGYELMMTSLFNLPSLLSNYSPRTTLELFYEYGFVIRGGLSVLFLVGFIYFVIMKNRLMVSLGSAILLFLLVSIIAILKSNLFYERYLLIIQPLTVLFILTFLAEIGQRTKYAKFIGLVGGGLWLVFSSHMLSSATYNVHWKPQHREGFEKIKQHLNNDVVSYVSVPYFFEWPIAKFYLQDTPNVVLMDKTYNFYTQLDEALQLTPEKYTQMAIEQLKEAQCSEVGQIFIYTRRGRPMLADIQETLKDNYNLQILDDTPTKVVYLFMRKQISSKC